MKKRQRTPIDPLTGGPAATPATDTVDGPKPLLIHIFQCIPNRPHASPSIQSIPFDPSHALSAFLWAVTTTTWTRAPPLPPSPDQGKRSRGATLKAFSGPVPARTRFVWEVSSPPAPQNRVHPSQSTTLPPACVPPESPPATRRRWQRGVKPPQQLPLRDAIDPGASNAPNRSGPKGSAPAVALNGWQGVIWCLAPDRPDQREPGGDRPTWLGRPPLGEACSAPIGPGLKHGAHGWEAADPGHTAGIRRVHAKPRAPRHLLSAPAPAGWGACRVLPTVQYSAGAHFTRRGSTPAASTD